MVLISLRAHQRSQDFNLLAAFFISLKSDQKAEFFKPKYISYYIDGEILTCFNFKQKKQGGASVWNSLNKIKQYKVRSFIFTYNLVLIKAWHFVSTQQSVWKHWNGGESGQSCTKSSVKFWTNSHRRQVNWTLCVQHWLQRKQLCASLTNIWQQHHSGAFLF